MLNTINITNKSNTQMQKNAQMGKDLFGKW